jgi:hypothetical protein
MITGQQEVSTQIANGVSRMEDKLVKECQMIRGAVREMDSMMKDRTEAVK